MSQALINAMVITCLGLLFTFSCYWANLRAGMRLLKYMTVLGVCGGFFVACYGLGLVLVEVSP